MPSLIEGDTETAMSLIFRLCVLAAFVLSCSATVQARPRLVHVFVALADNEHQWIAPVPPAIGNGDDPGKNLYWGAMYGVRAYFRKSRAWKEIAVTKNLNSFVLERSVFLHRASGTYMVADAYRGREIKRALRDFFQAAAGRAPSIAELGEKARGTKPPLPSKASLVVYVGHDVLMEPLPLTEFMLRGRFSSAGEEKREAIMLACKSKQFFRFFLRPTGARPLLWTTGLMAPEAYTLKAALDGWIASEGQERIRARAAAAYAKYQKISLKAARRLFSSGCRVEMWRGGFRLDISVCRPFRLAVP